MQVLALSDYLIVWHPSAVRDNLSIVHRRLYRHEDQHTGQMTGSGLYVEACVDRYISGVAATVAARMMASVAAQQSTSGIVQSKHQCLKKLWRGFIASMCLLQ